MNAVILTMAMVACAPPSTESIDADDAVAFLSSVREKNPWLRTPPLIVQAGTGTAFPNGVRLQVTTDLPEAPKPVEASETSVSRGRLIPAAAPAAKPPPNLDIAPTVSLVKTRLLMTPDKQKSIPMSYSHIRTALEMDLGDSNLPEIARTEDGLSAFATRAIYQTETSRGLIVEGAIHTLMGWWDENSQEVSGFVWNEGSAGEQPPEWMMEATGVASEELLIELLKAISASDPKQWDEWVQEAQQTSSSKPD